MKETIKSIFVGVIVLVLALGLFYYIFDPSFRANISSQFSFGGINKLDLVKNPAKYEGKEVTLKNAFIMKRFPNPLTGESAKDVISVEESDGHFVDLPYYYYRTIYCSHADLKGEVKNTVQQQEGLVPVNADGTTKTGKYYFDVSEVNCRN